MDLLFKDISLQGDETVMSVKKTCFFYVIDKWFYLSLVRTRRPGSFFGIQLDIFCSPYELGRIAFFMVPETIFATQECNTTYSPTFLKSEVLKEKI
jgi:hypothetical protein